MTVVPDNAYICEDGHLSEADDWDYSSVVGQADPPKYDYTKHCRRNVWREGGEARVTFTIDGKVLDERLPGKAMVQGRCKLPVVPAKDRPEVYAAYLLGGEDAARAIMVQTEAEAQHGKAPAR